MLNRFHFVLALAAVATVLPVSPVWAKTPGTIVDVAAGAPQFTTLVSAVKAAGLAATLSGKGPFTVSRRQTRRLRNFGWGARCAVKTGE